MPFSVTLTKAFYLEIKRKEEEEASYETSSTGSGCNIAAFHMCVNNAVITH